MQRDCRTGKCLLQATVLTVAVIFSAPGRGAQPVQPVKATPEMIEEAASLKKREDAVNEREKEVALRLQELQQLDQEVTEKLKRLTALQEDVQQKLQYIESLNVKDKEFKQLIKVYSAMSATKLAPLLDEMEDANVAKILRAMQTDTTAKIIPKLDKEKAVRVSRILGMID